MFYILNTNHTTILSKQANAEIYDDNDWEHDWQWCNSYSKIHILSKKGDGFSNILMVMMMLLMVMVMRRWLTAMSHSSPNIHMLSKEGCQCTVTQHLVFPSDSLTECPLSTVASWHCVIMWHPPAQCSNVAFCDTVTLSWATVQSHSPLSNVRVVAQKSQPGIHLHPPNDYQW